jgi:hypothetical protein
LPPLLSGFQVRSSCQMPTTMCIILLETERWPVRRFVQVRLQWTTTDVPKTITPAADPILPSHLCVLHLTAGCSINAHEHAEAHASLPARQDAIGDTIKSLHPDVLLLVESDTKVVLPGPNTLAEPRQALLNDICAARPWSSRRTRDAHVSTLVKHLTPHHVRPRCTTLLCRQLNQLATR